MAKFRGVVGFADSVEKKPGIYVEDISERRYSGDLIRNHSRLESSGSINDDIKIQNEISILADAYAFNHFHAIRYVEFAGAKWKITSVDATKRPRLVLTLGGVYNE